MAKTAEIQKAVELANTQRGSFLIGQALYVAIQALEKVPAPYTEKSNIADMRALQAAFFPYELVAAAQEHMAKTKE